MKSKSLLAQFSSRGWALLIIILLIRIGEHISFQLFHNIDIRLYHQIVINGLLRDAFMVFHFSLLLIIPYYLLGIVSKKMAGLFQTFLSSILILTHFLLIRYFFSTLSLLDGVIISVDPQHLFFIMGSEAIWTDWHQWLFIILLFMALYAFWFLAKRNLHHKISQYTYFILLVASTALFPLNNLEKNFFEDTTSHNLTNNKEIFLVRDIISHLEREAKLRTELKNIDWTIKNFQRENNQFDFTSEEYPLLHHKQNNDVLGPMFSFKKTMPNFVFIFSESLSRSFSGPNANIGSFTPFLDSLKNHSIYFENFLSNSDRTYGVFTNLLASLPNANERGVVNMGTEMPKILSFPQLLRQNGYTNSMFYGGWSSFDQMGKYFKAPLADHLFTESDFSPPYKEIRDKSDGLNWGFSDNMLYSRSFELMKEFDITPPYCNMFLTISLHTPFGLPYTHEGKFDKTYTELKKLYVHQGKKEEEYYTSYEKVFKACLFADASVKEFLQQYKKREEFNNTIFIIVGDHHSWKIYADNELKRYHVPLIIYSPLLNASKSISAISTHRDIVPSLLAMLENNFHFNQPQIVPWLGTGLDTSSTFQSHNINSFSILKGENGFLYKDYYWSESTPLKKILPNMDWELIQNDTLETFIKERFNDWHAVSRYTIFSDRIIPH